jgi:hypothetical protein
MTPNIKYHKILLIKNFLEHTHQARNQLFDELVINATDPTLYHRRFRMLSQLSQFENQIIKKIQDFDTDDVNDLSMDMISRGIAAVLHKSA